MCHPIILFLSGAAWLSAPLIQQIALVGCTKGIYSNVQRHIWSRYLSPPNSAAIKALRKHHQDQSCPVQLQASKLSTRITRTCTLENWSWLCTTLMKYLVSGKPSLTSQAYTFTTTQPDDATFSTQSKAGSTRRPSRTQHAGSKPFLSKHPKTEDTTTQG